MSYKMQNFFVQYTLWILVGILALTILLCEHPVSPMLKPNLKKMSNDPDAWITEVNSYLFRSDGTIKLLLQADTLMHFTKDDSTLLSQPKVTIYKDSPNPWVITSLSGNAFQGSKIMTFSQQVHIQHKADSAHPDTDIFTDSLTVEMEKSLAYTSSPIELRQPFTKIFAVGMHANLTNGEIRLLSNARGEYVTHNK